MKHGFIKVAAAAPEIRVADPMFNADAVIRAMDEHARLGVKVLVFPELTLTGATCGDLFYQNTLLAGAAAALVLFCTVTLPPPDLSRTSMQMVKTLFTGLLHPNWELFFRLDSSGLAYLLLETVAIALVGTCVGAVFSVPLAFLGSSRFFPAPAAWLFRTLVTAIRSVPFLIYGLIFIRVCGPGSFTGVLTLAVCSVGLLCKRFTEAIDTLDFRAYHALEAMGTPKLSCVRHAALPQLVPQFFSAWLYRFDVNIREASALGLAGAGGIGAPLILALNQYAWHDVSTLALGMIALSWLVDLVSAFCRRRDA